MTAAAVVSGAGLLEVNENMTFAGQSLAHLAIQGGTVTGPFTPTGDLTLSGGTLDGASTTTIAASSIVNINSGISLRHGKKLINNGTVRWSAGTICLGEAAGVTNNTANFTLTGDGSSMVDCAGGAATTFTNNQSGWVTAAVPTGIAINVPFTNNGKLKIDLGNVTVNGNYAPAVNSTLQVKVAGNEPGFQFGHLHVSGTMTIAGNLMLTADPGFSPDLNDTFAIADAGGASPGSFQSTSQSPLSTPNGMGYGVTYPAKTVLLTASLAADLSVSVSAPSSATVGTNITYTDFVLNSGPNPTSVTLTHTIPSGLTFVSASAGCTSTTTLVTCTVGTMNANTSKNVLVVLHSTFVDGYDVTAKVVGAGTLDVTPSGAVSTKHVNVT
jgi:uncharacterized repeat protein (TIGR01451 family)